jgi:hypothetical protein
MNDRAKTNSELIKKNSALKQRIKELEYSEAESKRAESAPVEAHGIRSVA